MLTIKKIRARRPSIHLFQTLRMTGLNWKAWISVDWKLIGLVLVFVPSAFAMVPESSVAVADAAITKIYTLEEFLGLFRAACISGDEVEIDRLLKLGVSDQVEPVIPSTQEELDKKLIVEAELGNFNKVRVLLSHGAHVNAVDQLGESVLLKAAGKGNVKMCDLLIASGANMIKEEADRLLLQAALDGNEVMSLFLIKNGADVNARERGSDQRKTALVAAISQGQESVCRILINARADVNATYIPDWVHNQTVLGCAVGYHNQPPSQPRSNEGIIRMLLSAKADIAGRNSDGETALFKAAVYKHADLCDLLMQLTSSCAKSTLNALYALKKQGVLLGQVLYNNRDALLITFIDKHRALAKKLLNETHDYDKARPFDHLQIDCLNPVSISYDPTAKELDALAKTVALDKLYEKKLLLDAATCAVSRHELEGQECLIKLLLGAAKLGYESVCELLVYRQHRVNARTMTALLCMNRLKAEGNGCAQFLYRYFKPLLFPYLYRGFSYIPITQLLNVKDEPDSFGRCKRAYDHLAIACLDSRLLPNKVKK